MSNLDQLLTEDLAKKNNMDPRGIKWGIHPIKGSALYEVRVVEGNKNSAIPGEVAGRWTSAPRAQAAIESYLRRAWEENAKAEQKSARKQQVTE